MLVKIVIPDKASVVSAGTVLGVTETQVIYVKVVSCNLSHKFREWNLDCCGDICISIGIQMVFPVRMQIIQKLDDPTHLSFWIEWDCEIYDSTNNEEDATDNESEDEYTTEESTASLLSRSDGAFIPVESIEEVDRFPPFF